MFKHFLPVLIRLLTVALLVTANSGSLATRNAQAYLTASAPASIAPASVAPASVAPAAPSPAGISLFRNPVVPGAVISGYFDHNPSSSYVTFYDGRRNADPAYGFRFTCGSPYMNDFVGCEDNVSGVNACSPSRQLWYDNHHGTDYEYSTNWYTGATCDPGRFNGITHPVYAPAKGRVIRAGQDPNSANGWSVLMAFDANHDGNYDNDRIRAFFLHFTPYQIAVSTGQIVEEGQYLGLGGTSGYSSSPHLHFEVQRSADGYNWYPVDPYGWQGSGADPWGYTNINLWQSPVVEPPPPPTAWVYLPSIHKDFACPEGCELVQNGGFEAGHQIWGESGVQVIASIFDINLHIRPASGSWLAWLGGRYGAADVLYQDMTVPGDASSARLVYQLYLDPNAWSGDRMVVKLRDASNNTSQQVDSIDRSFSPSGEWVQRSIDLPDVTAWQGQTLRLSFEATTTNGTNTSFYVDDVSFRVSP